MESEEEKYEKNSSKSSLDEKENPEAGKDQLSFLLSQEHKPLISDKIETQVEDSGKEPTIANMFGILSEIYDDVQTINKILGNEF